MTIEDKLKEYAIVGNIESNLANKVNFLQTGIIYAAPGVVKHIKKKHSHELSPMVLNNLLNTIKTVLIDPEWIGRHPGKNGMEFVKTIDDNIMVTIEVDIKDKYIYVSSLYPIPISKINRRLNSGRLIKI